MDVRINDDDDDRSKVMTDLKIDLADGCDSVLEMLGQQLDNGNCNSIVRVDVGYFHTRRNDPATLHNQRHYRTSRLSNDELSLVFQGIVCCLPRMKTLVVMSYFRADAMTLPVSALEMLFRRANNLEILFLHQIKLQGSPDEFRVMARSLDRHPALKRVNLHCCCDSTDDDAEIHDIMSTSTSTSRNNGHVTATSLDHLVCGLAKLPTLYYLSLDQVPITEVSIRALSQSLSLRDVSFYNMPQIKSSLPILFRTLYNHSGEHGNGAKITGCPSSARTTTRSISSFNLRGLRIRSCELDQTEAVMIAQMLENNSSLESVVFYVDSWEDYGGPLAAALVHNTSLKRLEVGIGRNQHHQGGGGGGGGGGGVETNGAAEDNASAAAHDEEGASNNVSSHSGLRSAPRTVQEESNHRKHAQAATALATALECNHKTSLRYFSLNLLHADSNVIYDAYMKPFGKMLESNYVLENFFLQGANNFSVMSPGVGFLLRLNQRSGLNRRKLFQAVVEHDTHKADSRQLWVNTLGRHTEELSILYYLVRRNPNLVSGAVLSAVGCRA